MKYIDGFVLVVPKKNVSKYKKIATQAGKIWKKCGALEYFECVGDDLNPKFAELTFPKLVKLKAGESVWFSFIIYKSKKHRDNVNAKVMKDPFMNDPKNKNLIMPFDMKRMAYGGFKAIVEK
jgi:alkaline phosphatase